MNNPAPVSSNHTASAVLIAVLAVVTACWLPHVVYAGTTTAPSAQYRLEHAAEEPGNWLLHGRTYSEQRYSTLDRISTANVDKLGHAWSYDFNTERGLEATPIVRDGVLFTTGAWSTVSALDAASGRPLWSYDPKVPRGWGRKGCCDVVNRGVAVWEDRVFAGTFDGRLVALDAETGELLWEVNTVDRSRFSTITGAPRVANGKVFIGNGGAEFGVRGYVSAYDAMTGALVWRFYTVPRSDGKPQEHAELEPALETWSDSGAWLESGGGGTVWDSIVYDPELNLLYVGTGNGSPHARHLRSPGGGDNLYLSSILALDADTGSMKWFYQTTPGDSWDYTATQQIILADLVIDGSIRKVLMQAPKNGFFYVLDRRTGELLSAEKYATATWASHIENGRPVETGQGDYSDTDRLVYPSELGAHNWQAMSFNPGTGLAYIPVNEMGWVFSPTDIYLFEHRVPHIETLRKGQPAVDTGGFLRAWDVRQQKLAWQVKNTALVNGGTLSTAGGLVFQGTQDGYLNGYDARTGERLLKLFLGTGIVAPPITYAVGDEQYIAIMAGFGGATLFWVEDGAAARRFRNSGRLIVLKLDGGAVPLPGKETRPAWTYREPKTERLRAGEQVFVRYCGFCHGMYGTRSVLPDLTNLRPEVEAIFDQIVLEGLFEAKGMAGFSDVLDGDDVKLIREYLRFQSGSQ